MITLTGFAQDIVNQLKPLMPEGWHIAADLGELTESKDMMAYFAVVNQNVIIPNNATMRLDCELVGSTIFEHRTKEEVVEMITKIADAAYRVFNSMKKYSEMECGAIFLECSPSATLTEVDDLYYSFKLPVVMYAQF